MSKEFAYGKAVTKDQAYLRKHPKFLDQLKMGHGELTDLSANHTITLDWKLNEWATADKVFKLTIDNKEVYLDLDELLYYTRVMFVK